ncbi:MAG: ribonuclease activity regulator RraA [Geminicoccaceae bacterium]|nr:MAG: ribonuclease activity regulator RraA [Geminicoccaceae bacterium]
MADLLDRLRALPVPTLSACLYAEGYPNAFIAGLAPLDPVRVRFAGPARTLRAIPVRPDQLRAVQEGQAPNMHRQALAVLRHGDVLVTDTGGAEGVSLFGEIITTFLHGRGVAAIVTDAGIADVVDVGPIGLPIFARGSAPVPGPAQVLVSDVDRPIACRGVPVYPGDLVVGDGNGVVVIPEQLAETIAAKAEAKEELERFLLARVRDGAPLDGTYPPDAATLEAFARSRQAG